jgi:hypothetical protein
MRAGDDTYTPGLLISRAVSIVGARRAAAFVVHKGENNCDTLRLFKHFSHTDEDDATAAEASAALRQYVIPCLMDDTDRAIEVPGSRGVAGKSFALVFLARDLTGVRGVTVMLVEGVSDVEARRRLAALQRVMSE